MVALPFFSKKNKDTIEYFLGLSLKEQSGVAYLLEVDHKLSHIAIKHRIALSFSNGWDHLIEDVDEALYQLEKQYNVKVQKVIYFIYSHFLSDDLSIIKEPQKSKLAKVSTELGLEALGYIEHHEAISGFLTVTHGGPFTASLIEIDTTNTSVFIYKASELIFHKTIATTKDITSDMEYVLEQAAQKTPIPPEFIVYDSSMTESLSAQLAQHQWKAGIATGTPGIRIVPSTEVDSALLHAVSTQLFPNTVENKSTEAMIPVTSSMDTEFETPVASAVSAPTTFDFQVYDDDTDTAISPLQAAPSASHSFGHDETSNDIGAESEDTYEDSQQDSQENSILSNMSMSVASFFSSLSNVGRKPKTSLLIVVIGLILMAVSLGSLLYYFHKATVSLTPNTTPLEKDITVSDKLTVSKHTKEFTAKESINTSGTKFVGEKSKGTIQIVNADTKQLVLEKGTVLKSESGQQFVLDQEVKVASASVQLTSSGDVLTVTGKQTAPSSAEDIGPEYNIKKDTKLSVANKPTSSVFATATVAFSGGSKKEVPTASKQDLTQLREKVDNAITKKADAELQSQGSDYLIKDLTEIKALKEDFSNEIAEEADTISINKKAEVIYYTYNKDQLTGLLVDVLKESTPEDLQLQKEYIRYEIKKTENKGGKYTFSLGVKAFLTKKIDMKALTVDLKGKSLEAIKDSVLPKYDIKEMSAQIDTPIPFLRSRMPFFEQNIEVGTNIK